MKDRQKWDYKYNGEQVLFVAILELIEFDVDTH